MRDAELDLDAELIKLRTKAVYFGLQGKPTLASHYRSVADNLSYVRSSIEKDEQPVKMA